MMEEYVSAVHPFFFIFVPVAVSVMAALARLQVANEEHHRLVWNALVLAGECRGRASLFGSSWSVAYGRILASPVKDPLGEVLQNRHAALFSVRCDSLCTNKLEDANT